MKRTLVLFSAASAAFALVAVPTADPPVCIVGAGPTGLTIANRLESRAQQAVIFEKKDKVGGKCQAYYDEGGQFHPLGALLFSNETYKNTVPVVEASGVTSFPFSYNDTGNSWLYNWTTGDVQQLPPLSDAQRLALAAEIQRYITFWTTVFAPANLTAIGYRNGIPAEYTVPAATWLNTNGYQLLPSLFVNGMVPYGYGDIRQTATIYMLQYFTPDILLFFAGQQDGYITDFHAVFEQYAKKFVASPIYLSTDITNIDRSGEYPTITYSNQTVSSATQSCLKIILAFPPVLRSLEAANLDLSEDETTVFSPIGTTNYWSGAVSVNTPYPLRFAAATPAPGIPPDAAGEPVAVLRLFNDSNVATTWSWGKYRGNETFAQAKELLQETITKFNRDPRITPPPMVQTVTPEDVKDFRGWNYFPRYDEAQLAAGYYGKFNDLQGQNNTYYASGFNGFETVEFAIRAGIDIVETYFPNFTTSS